MKTKSPGIDRAGRIVIPRDVRARAGLEPGMPLRIEVRDGRIEIEPMPRLVKIEKRGRVHVAVPETPSKKLTSDEVRDAIDEVRRRGIR